MTFEVTLAPRYALTYDCPPADVIQLVKKQDDFATRDNVEIIAPDSVLDAEYFTDSVAP